MVTLGKSAVTRATMHLSLTTKWFVEGFELPNISSAGRACYDWLHTALLSDTLSVIYISDAQIQHVSRPKYIFTAEPISLLKR